MQKDYVTKDTPLLFFEMYWDTIQDNDNIEENIANDIRDEFIVKLDQDRIEQLNGFIGKLNVVVERDNKVINPRLEWYTTDEELVVVDDNGNYELIGEDGEAQIKVNIKNNTLAYDVADIIINDPISDDWQLVVETDIDHLYLHESKDIIVRVYNNGIEQEQDIECVPSGASPITYSLVSKDNNTWNITNNNMSNTDLVLTFKSENVSDVSVNIKLKSLF